MFRISIILFVYLSISHNAIALNTEKIEQLTELMFLTCSLGKDTVLNVSAEGNLMFLKKGIKGKFEANRSEMPNIIKFLTSDNAKHKQANEIRKCTMHYMDKIFNEIIGKSKSNTEDKIKNSNGVVMKLLSCDKKNRNNIVCKFNLTSTFRDRFITIRVSQYDKSSQLFDNASNRYFPNKVQIANHNSRENSSLDDIPIIADVKVDFKLVFTNISTAAKSISLLKVGTRIKVDNKVTNEFFDFRDIEIN